MSPRQVGRGADVELGSSAGGELAGGGGAFGRRLGTSRGGGAFGRRAFGGGKRRLQSEYETTGNAFTTPDVVLPSHLHYFYHGCDRQAGRDVMHPLPRVPCKQQAISAQTSSGRQLQATPRVAGRVLVESLGAELTTGPGGALPGGAGSSAAAGTAGAGASGGAAAASGASRVRAAGSSAAEAVPGGMRSVAIEWATPAPLPWRNVSPPRPRATASTDLTRPPTASHVIADPVSSARPLLCLHSLLGTVSLRQPAIEVRVCGV
jgi:hypothetical protein